MYRALLSAKRASFTIKHFPTLSGYTWGQVRMAVPDAVVCGVVRGMTYDFFPRDNLVLQASDRLLLVANEWQYASLDKQAIIKKLQVCTTHRCTMLVGYDASMHHAYARCTMHHHAGGGEEGRGRGGGDDGREGSGRAGEERAGGRAVPREKTRAKAAPADRAGESYVATATHCRLKLSLFALLAVFDLLMRRGCCATAPTGGGVKTLAGNTAPFGFQLRGNCSHPVLIPTPVLWFTLFWFPSAPVWLCRWGGAATGPR